MLLDELVIDADAFEAGTGWAVKPQGACKGEVCVPLPANARTTDGSVDVTIVADALGMPIVEDAAHQLRALGPESRITGRALTTATADDVVLPDLDGNPFNLASLHGQKVLLVAWASW
jgi:hypothetical protein